MFSHENDFPEDEDVFDGWAEMSPFQRLRAYAFRIARNRFEALPESAVHGSLYTQLVQSLGAEVIRDDPLEQPYDAEATLSPIWEFVDDLYWGVGGDSDVPNPNFWHHRSDPVGEAKRKQAPNIDRDSVERATDAYLGLPVRSQLVDRTLTDILLATEVYAFAAECFGPYSRLGIRGRGPLAFLAGRGCSLLVVGALIGGVLMLRWIGLIGDGWTTGLIVAVVGLFLLEAVWALIVLPFGWWAQTKQRGKVGDLMGQMVGVYAEMSSAGSVSAKHLRERAQAASAAGVSWPAPLFTLLDDVIDRGARL